MNEMNHLSALDAGFLHMETAETPMHVGSLHHFEMPEGYAGNWFEDVKAHVAQRMHLAPVFTRKLAAMPFELANPIWIEDDDIDLDQHIRHVTLPAPCSEERLHALIARLHSTLLDRSRPLWEFYAIDGLPGNSRAFYMKLHHAGIDGKAGVAFASAMFDATPEPRVIRKPHRRKSAGRYQLGFAELLGAAVQNNVAQTAKLVSMLPRTARAMYAAWDEGNKEWAKGAASNGLLAQLKTMKFKAAPRTPFNVTITNQRSFTGVSLLVDDVKRVAKLHGASVNDVGMWICSTALRRYLKDANELPDESLMAAVPISVRAEGDTSANNQVTMGRVELFTNEGDPLKRLAGIKASAQEMKRNAGGMRGAIPMDFPSLGVPMLASGMASLMGRSKLSERLPAVANVLISNVPRPREPLYMAGGKMSTYLPVSAISHGMALNMTIHGYNDQLAFGLLACRRTVPDIEVLGSYILPAFEELCILSQHVAVREAMAKPREKRRPEKALAD
ncbi:wax ester/triacylglycerol synthase family O-acyltransferase [Variovorax sp. dw_954]|uniref:WS/DGAT/MGAT family O-acyltransferase n=1 Tax=Variovorax sp. dw_954 TaxID=2720078 RepID=UPI001BD4D3A9|nr:wax ester/triacylglycerol synthase family O-acyltransferase [Variovorax sp. dw_954]